MHPTIRFNRRKLTGVALGLACVILSGSSAFAPPVSALTFLGVASGDATTSDAVIWTRAVDTAAPAAATLVGQVSTDPTLATGVLSFSVTTDPAKDYTAKVVASGLSAGTRYYYRFVNDADASNASLIGTFKTPPDASAAAAVRFAFSGDADGLMRPYALAHEFPSLGLDFFMWTGDTIYETASSNSPAVAVSGTITGPTTNGASQAQLYTDYSRKYREQFLPVHPGGQNCLQPFFLAQGNYTLYDNHELGNRQYINGGAIPGGPVGDMLTGAGVDARVPANDVNTTGLFMNKATGFQILQRVYLNYQPVHEHPLISAPADPRTDGTPRLYLAQRWGKHVLFVNTDARTYREIRMKTAANADDTGPRADNPGRTMFGVTQLAWLKQTLLDAQNDGVSWKFVTVSDPIDQLGPIGGALTGTLTSVNADGGKSFMGGYRAERNDLFKFIADNHILNVVFFATDDHQNRVNELLYSPTGETSNQLSYVRVPHSFSIVCGPLGATGPETITDHSFTNVQAIANNLAAAQIAAGLDPIGLDAGYPGLFNVVREGDPSADTLRQPIDFYSPDTFNFASLEVSDDGKTLTVKSFGINSTPQNAQAEYDPINNPMREILAFSIDASPEPAFTECPGSLTLTNDPGQCSASLALPVTASGLPAPVITCTVDSTAIDSPFAFPVGTTTVNCTASNVLGTANCDFTVTVEDHEAPLVACRPAPNPSGKIPPGAKGNASNPNGFFELLSEDNCDPNPQIYVQDSASAFIAGPFASGSFVKITSNASATPSQKNTSGQVSAQITFKGTPLLFATDADGNVSTPIPSCTAP